MTQQEVQSIYGRGYKDGVRDGIENMRQKGWRRVESPDELQAGDTVKMLERTIFGWKGRFRVTHVHGDMVEGVRIDDYKSHDCDSYCRAEVKWGDRDSDDICSAEKLHNEVGCMYWEVVKLYKKPVLSL